jgi:hypothetical protein
MVDPGVAREARNPWVGDNNSPPCGPCGCGSRRDQPGVARFARKPGYRPGTLRGCKIMFRQLRDTTLVLQQV